MAILLILLSIATSLYLISLTGVTVVSAVLLAAALPVWYVAWFFVLLGLEYLVGWFFNVESPVKAPKRFWYRVLAATAKQKLLVSNVRLKVTGRENLPSGPAVFVCNHPSSYDMLAMMAKLSRKQMVFLVQKKEEVPLNFGCLHKAGLQKLEKPGSKQSERAIQRAVNWMSQQQTDVCFAPEGSVSKSGDLQAFRPTAFQTAIRAKAPIVVVTFGNAGGLDDTFLLKRKTVSMKIEKPIQPDEFQGKNPVEIGAMVRKIIKENLKSK